MIITKVCVSARTFLMCYNFVANLTVLNIYSIIYGYNWNYYNYR